LAKDFILAGDLGATTTRLGLFEAGAAPARPAFERNYAGADFAEFAAVLARFLADCRSAAGEIRIERACLGVAGPVAGARVRMTNLAWTIEADAVSAGLGGARVVLLNDFEAAAHGIDALAPDDRLTIQEGAPRTEGAQVVIGAGTGLGVAYRFWTGDRRQIVAGEGGHTGFAPADEQQSALLRALLPKLGRVSAEHVVSGAGLARIHGFLGQMSGAARSAGTEDPAEISRRALTMGDPLAARALDLFIACYGAVAGDHALAVCAYGGVYVVGGIAAKILPRLAAGGFIAAFNAKGSHSTLARAFPVHVVTAGRLGLLGAAQVAAMQ
jgi:glucokinase